MTHSFQFSRNLKALLPLLSLAVLLLTATASAQSQWTEEGLLLSNQPIDYSFVEPDHAGGFWVLYDNYLPAIDNPRPKIQHIDANGNKLLGPEGKFVCADTMAVGWTLGLACLPDNGVAVAYTSSLRIDTTTASGQVFGQRMTSSGERLLDTNGVQLTFLPTGMYKGNVWNMSSVCGDGSSGMWVVCTKGFSEERYVVGMNGDGSLKCDLQHLATGVPEQGLIQEDGRGGAYFFHHDTSYSNFSYALYFNHVDGDGNLSYTEINQQPVFGDLTETFSYLSAAIKEDGSLILEASDDNGWCFMQRINPDLTLPWGSDGYSTYAFQSRFSHPPVLLNDEIYFSAIDGGAYEHKFRIGVLSWGGVEEVDFLNNVLEQADTLIQYRPPLLTTAYSGGDVFPLAVVRRDHLTDLHQWDYYYTLHKISPDGTMDLWADNQPEVAGGYSGYVYDDEAAYSLSDGTILLDVPFRKDQNDSFLDQRHHFYKITPEGSIAGVNEHPTQSPLPDRTEILSASPNPFNSNVTITYSLPSHNPASLTVYDLTGREVMRTQLVSSAGAGKYVWQPSAGLASGVYFARLLAPGNSSVRKLLLLR